ATTPAASTPIGTYLANGNLIVAVQDQYGNVETGDTSTVSLSLTGPGGTVSGTTSVAASAGLATFGNLLVDSAGSGSVLTATDSADGLTVNSSAFAINSDSATHLVFTTEPSGFDVAGSKFSTVVVTVEDASGNAVT